MRRFVDTRAAALVALAVLCGGLAACGGSGSSPGGDATASGAAAHPAPSVTVAEVNRIVAEYDTANNAVNAGYDAAGVARIEGAPAAPMTASRLQQAKVLGQPLTSVIHRVQQVVSPSGQEYPRWFLVLTPLVRGTTVTPRPKYLIFSRETASAPWRVVYYPYPADVSQVPPVAVGPDGGAAPVLGGEGLKADPSLLTRAIYEHYTVGRDTLMNLVPTTALERELTAGFRVGQQQVQARGMTFSRTLLPTSYPSYLVRTVDGGVLAFTANAVRDVIAPGKAGGQASLEAGSPESALLGRTGSVKASEFTVDRLQTFLTYVPPKSAPGGVQVIAYDDTPTSVK